MQMATFGKRTAHGGGTSQLLFPHIGMTFVRLGACVPRIDVAN
jgi:hypothetical protein